MPSEFEDGAEGTARTTRTDRAKRGRAEFVVVRPNARLTIGELARRAGVGVETVRYYQRRGLFPEPAPIAPRATREYAPEALELLRFIRRARTLGFTIREVERLVALRRSRKDPRDLLAMLAAKTSDLERQVQEKQTAMRVLSEMTARAESLAPAERWQLFDSEPAGVTGG